MKREELKGWNLVIMISDCAEEIVFTDEVKKKVFEWLMRCDSQEIIIENDNVCYYFKKKEILSITATPCTLSYEGEPKPTMIRFIGEELGESFLVTPCVNIIDN